MKYGFRKQLVAAVAIPFALVASSCSDSQEQEQAPPSTPSPVVVETPAPEPVAADTLAADTLAADTPSVTPGPNTAASTQPAATPPASSRGRTTADGVYTMAQASRGENHFQNICSACHNATDFTGSHFSHSWGSRTVGDIHEFISDNMPMDAPGSLTAQEYTDIVAYFIRQNGYPAGQTELPTSTATLKQIRFAPALAAGD